MQGLILSLVVFLGGISGLCVAVVFMRQFWGIDLLQEIGMQAEQAEPQVARNVVDPPTRRSKPAAIRPNVQSGRPDGVVPNDAPGNQTETAETTLPTTAEEILSEGPDPLVIPHDIGFANPREPAPSEVDQHSAEEMIRSLYQSEYEDAKSKTAKRMLARELIGVASETQDDPTSKFVLLRIAKDIGIAIGDPKLTEDAIGLLEKDYEIDSLELRLQACEKLAPEVNGVTDPRFVADELSWLATEFVFQNRFDQSVVAIDTALELAKSRGERKMVEDLTAKKEMVMQIINEFENVIPLIEELADNPRDAEANLSLGMYTSFTACNWNAGLPMIALGSDEALRSLAVLDLGLSGSLSESPESKGVSAEELAVAKEKIADGWWELAASLENELPEHATVNLKFRAGMWYQDILDDVAGLNRVRVEQRLKELVDLKETPTGRVVLAAVYPQEVVSEPLPQETPSRSIPQDEKLAECQACEGRGVIDCPKCVRGSVLVQRNVQIGVNPITRAAIMGTKSFKQPCPACSGVGTFVCQSCKK